MGVPAAEPAASGRRVLTGFALLEIVDVHGEVGTTATLVYRRRSRGGKELG